MDFFSWGELPVQCKLDNMDFMNKNAANFFLNFNTVNTLKTGY
jgi:hypothetical protein